MTARNYIPHVGDAVSSSEADGQFIVHSVDSERQTVDVRKIGSQSAVNILGLSWAKLNRLSREDVNQAAARIVREATED